MLAWLAGFRGPVAAADYAKSLTQDELEALGAWKNKKTGRGRLEIHHSPRRL